MKLVYRCMLLAALLFITGALIVVPETAHAQPRERPGPEGQRLDFLMYEAIAMPALDSNLVRVDIAYRIDADFFVPVRNTAPDAESPFQRRGEVLVELIDSTGVSHARSIERVDVGTTRSERNPFELEWHQGLASFNVRPGLYTVVMELTDLDSQRRHFDRSRTIRVSGSRRRTAEVSSAFFVSGSREPGDTLTLMNFGGDIRFGSPGRLVVLLPDPSDADTVLIDFTLKMGDPSDDETILIRPMGLRPAHTIRNVHLEPLRSAGPPRYLLKESPLSRTTGVVIPLNIERLPLRRFSIDLTVRHGSSEQKLTRQFRALWPDMPVSLRNVDNALSALRYIVSEEVLDSLQEGDFEARRNALEQFWKARDRTPETAYNEIQAEYYQRVDYATRTFGTLRAPDGSRSDRGRIYILYGPPSRTERTLDPTAGYREIWVYERIKKKFTFADRTRSGNYVLISSNAL